MASRYIQQEDSDVQINIASNTEDRQPIQQFEEDTTNNPSQPELPFWKRVTANPVEWYKGAVKEAKEFSWEITEPNHVVRSHSSVEA
jgi:hypothetical protein